MAGPDTLTIWLREQAWPILIVLMCVLLVYALLKFSAQRRIENLIRERAGISVKSFSEDLQRYGFDPMIATATYRYLQQVQRIQFPILASDSLDEDLGLDSEDVEQTVNELGIALQREQAPGLRYSPLVTVEDLVRLLQASPRARQSGRHVVAA
jgi:acyl carrier protein